jgi:hypothetical protein
MSSFERPTNRGVRSQSSILTLNDSLNILFTHLSHFQLLFSLAILSLVSLSALLKGNTRFQNTTASLFHSNSNSNFSPARSYTVSLAVPTCERTLLVHWGTFGNGFGHMYYTVLQVAYFAKANNYTLLFSREANNHGTFLDFFSSPVMSCKPTEEMYNTVQPEGSVDFIFYPSGCQSSGL